MPRPSNPPILSELRTPTSSAGQIAALRALKNEIIGHDQKKEMWIGLGVVPQLARILNVHKGSGKKRHRDASGGGKVGDRRGGRTDEEDARLQAIIIVGSLAYGGPAYISPLNAGLVVPPLLSLLSTSDSSAQVVLASLRALNTIADSASLERPVQESTEDSLANLLYNEQHLNSLSQIITQSSSSLVVQQQISLAASLITKTCREDFQRRLLAELGVLEALAIRISSFAIASGCSFFADCLPSRKELSSSLSNVPPPATTRSRLAPILEAVGTIIKDSKLRATQFLCGPALAMAFPRSEPDTINQQHLLRVSLHRSQWASNPQAVRQNLYRPIDALLPQLPSSIHRNGSAQAAGFPNLSGVGAPSKTSHRAGAFSSGTKNHSLETLHTSEEDENAFVMWLLYVIREEEGADRLMAAWVLAILYKFGLADRRREAGFALILVPLLVRMLDTNDETNDDALNGYDKSRLRQPGWAVTEYAPAILAMLIQDSIELQRAAVEADAIRKLSQSLKDSYVAVPQTPPGSPWTPEPTGTDDMDTQEGASSSRLGPSGLRPFEYHVIKTREAVLLALAAIAPFKDEYRKSIIDNGVVPFVIESLKSDDSISAVTKTGPDQSGDSPRVNNSSAGNPTSVLLAACGAARVLSRSVNTLRTSLIDAGVAIPLFALLKHPNIEVQVAATAVVCNLVLEFSPMRESIIEAGILSVLCEHAHSLDAKLRLNSVWALKHLVHTAPNSLKISCLEKLGPGWLKQLICTEFEESYARFIRVDRDSNSVTPISMGTPNAAGEQVDLLNAVHDDGENYRGVDEDMLDNVGALGLPQNENMQPLLSSRLNNGHGPTSDLGRARLSAVNEAAKEAEAISMRQARADDLAVQEQGLDLIRNLILGSGAPEMIDHMFQQLGQEKVFEMLTAKLRPKIIGAFNRDRKSSSASENNGPRHVPPQPEIIISVLYILIHIAAGLPRHRQLLISHGELFRLFVPLFGHAHREVRVCCAWLVINLTWVDDQADQPNCKSRAHELRKLGIYEKLEVLESDPELDVRERTKTAIHQMSNLLRG